MGLGELLHLKVDKFILSFFKGCILLLVMSLNFFQIVFFYFLPELLIIFRVKGRSGGGIGLGQGERG